MQGLGMEEAQLEDMQEEEEEYLWMEKVLKMV